MHPSRGQAIALRKKGASYREIEAATGIARSTLSYMLRSVALTVLQKERLLEKQRANGSRRLGWVPSEAMREHASVLGKKRWRNDAALRSRLRKGRALGRLAFRKDELPIKSALQAMLGAPVRREALGKRVIDFATDHFLIEYTTDHTHGVFDIVRRFEDTAVSADNRRKIAYLPLSKIGKKTTDRLTRVGVLIRDYRALG